MAESGVGVGSTLLAFAVAIVARALRLLPAWVAYGLADIFVPLLIVLTALRERRLRRRGRGMRRNLEIVFRAALTRRRYRRMHWAWARHMTWLAVDFCRMPLIRCENYAQSVDTTELDLASALARDGKGVIYASAHAGFWELEGHAATLHGIPLIVIARPVASPRLERILTALRTSGGQEVRHKWGVLWGVQKALEAGQNIGLLADEDVRRRPVFVPFLGTLASANPALAHLHLATGAPIIVITCPRVARARYRYRVWDIVRHESCGDREVDYREILARVSAGLTRGILAYPEQWIWGSRRFATRPPNEVPDSSGLPPVVPGDRLPFDEAARRFDGCPNPVSFHLSPDG